MGIDEVILSRDPGVVGCMLENWVFEIVASNWLRRLCSARNCLSCTGSSVGRASKELIKESISGSEKLVLLGSVADVTVMRNDEVPKECVDRACAFEEDACPVAWVDPEEGLDLSADEGASECTALLMIFKMELRAGPTTPDKMDDSVGAAMLVPA